MAESTRESTKIIKVGMAEYKISSNPGRLCCYGLGSCVAIALYDREAKIGGLAHVMLPTSKYARKTMRHKPAKFADLAVVTLIDKMEKRGVKRNRVVAKIFGGANMFSTNGPGESILDIGKRNVAAVKEKLKEERIRLVAEDTGGSYGRSIEFHIDTGKVIVRTKVNKNREF